MSAKTGYYWLVQYCNDLERMETVNVGVVLFIPENGFLCARMGVNTARLRRCFKSQDVDFVHVEAMKSSIAHGLELSRDRLGTVEEVNAFLRTRGDEIVVTPPREVRVEDAANSLQSLWLDLVEDPLPVPSVAAAMVNTRPGVVETLLALPDLSGKLVRNVSVELPGFHERITVPLGYQNGRFNLIQPVQFQTLKGERLREVASARAVEARYLYNNPSPRFGEMQMIVVGDISQRRRGDREIVQQILDYNEARFYTIADLQLLEEDIRVNGKPRPDLSEDASAGVSGG